MGSTLATIDVPLPRTLNTDTSPSQLRPHESADLRNVVTSEPGQVRMRRGWRRKYNLFNDLNEPRDSILTGVRTVGTEMLVSYRRFTAPDVVEEWLPLYFYTQDLSGYITTEGDDESVLMATDIGAGTWFLRSVGTSFRAVIGKTINYEKAAYGVTTDSVSGQRWRGYTGTGTEVTAEALYRWAGKDGTYNVNATASINNGNTVGTFSADPTGGAESVAGYFLQVGATTTLAERPAAGHWYTYLITSHSGVTFTLDRPYGLGEPVTNVPNLVAEPVNLRAEVQVANAPIGCQAVGLYKERIFTGRGHLLPAVGTYSGYYRNLLMWSEPGQPEKWPSQNFFIVDDDYNDPIMGLGTVADQLVIFKRTKALVLTGTDETNFVIDNLSDRIGCVYSGSITNHEDRLVWASEDGIHAYDGQTIEDLTQPEPGRGIKNEYRRRMTKDDGSRSKYMMRWPVIHPVRDDLVVALPDSRFEERDSAFVYNTRNKTWVEWGRRKDEADISANLLSEDLAFQGFVTINENVYGLMSWQYVAIDKCFDFEQYDVDGLLWTSFDNLDQLYSDTGSQVSVFPTCHIQVPDIHIGNSDTVRVREVAVAHNCHYASTTVNDINRAVWQMTLGADPTFTTANTYNVEAHWVDNTAILPTTVLPDHDSFYLDRYPLSFSLEGSVFRLNLTTESVISPSYKVLSHKLFGIRLLVDPQKTRLNRNQ